TARSPLLHVLSFTDGTLSGEEVHRLVDQHTYCHVCQRRSSRHERRSAARFLGATRGSSARGVRACDPPLRVAARPCAALATKRERSPQARVRRKEARARSQSSVECASHVASEESAGAHFFKFLTCAPRRPAS